MTDESDDRTADQDTAELEEQLAMLAMLISQARELVRSGHTIDLSGLSTKIGDFCAKITADPPADAESVARMIDALVGDLNLLGEELAEQQAQLSRVGSPPKGNGG